MSSTVTFTFVGPLGSQPRRTIVRWRWRGIDDFRVVGVQLAETID